MVRANLSEDTMVKIQQLVFTKTNVVLNNIKNDFKKYRDEGPHVQQ